MSKQTVFQGMEMEVPDWVNFITQDKHGTIKAWDREPRLVGREWVGFGNYDIICQASAPALLVAL